MSAGAHSHSPSKNSSSNNNNISDFMDDSFDISSLSSDNDDNDDGFGSPRGKQVSHNSNSHNNNNSFKNEYMLGTSCGSDFYGEYAKASQPLTYQISRSPSVSSHETLRMSSLDSNNNNNNNNNGDGLRDVWFDSASGHGQRDKRDNGGAKEDLTLSKYIQRFRFAPPTK